MLAAHADDILGRVHHRRILARRNEVMVDFNHARTALAALKLLADHVAAIAQHRFQAIPRGVVHLAHHVRVT